MADATVGALRVTLGADTAAFEDGLKRGQSALSGFSKNIATIAAGIGLEKIIEKSVEAMVGTFKEGFERIDRIGKEAQKVGIGVEAFSGLILSAELADVSMQTLSTSLGKLSKNMVETSQGTGEAQKTFQALGISVTNTDGTLKSSSQVLTEVAGKFETTADGATKTAAAIALFGRGGKELIPLLNEGAASLAEMTAAAQRMGLVIEQNTANQVQKFNDNLKILGKSGEGISNLVIAEIIPALVRLSESFVEGAKNGDLIRAIADRIVTTFKELTVTVFQSIVVVQDSAQVWTLLFQAFKAFPDVEASGKAFAQILEIFRSFEQRLDDARTSALGLFTQLTVSKKATEEITAGTSKFADAIASLQLRTREARGEFNAFTTGFAAHAAQLNLTDKAAKGLATTIGGLSPAQRELNFEMARFEGARMLNEALTPAERYEAQMQKINAIVQAQGISHEEAAKLMKKAAEDTGQSWSLVSKGIAQNFTAALDIMAKENQKFAVAAKAAAITLALINTYEGVTKALASVFWPLNLVAAGAVLAAGLAQVAAIAGLHFAKGGSFKVGGGLTGMDSEMVAFRATPGELVDVRRPGTTGAGGTPQTIHLETPRPGDFFSQHIRELVTALNKAAPDGYVLKMRPV